MFHNLIIEDSDVINTNKNIDVNSYLFYLLETADNLDGFCDACVEILSNFVKVKTLIIFKNLSDDVKKINILYQKNIDEKQECNLNLIHQIIKQELNLNNDCSNSNNLSCEKKNKYTKNLYVLPLNFKDNC